MEYHIIWNGNNKSISSIIFISKNLYITEDVLVQRYSVSNKRNAVGTIPTWGISYFHYVVLIPKLNVFIVNPAV